MIEKTWREGMKGMANGMMVAAVIPGKTTIARKRAMDKVRQQARCAACRGKCSSSEAAGVPVGMVIIGS
ncbi:MAG: hypothetical protein WAV16_01120 [Candidatus Moraniibacteriota bacterium]